MEIYFTKVRWAGSDCILVTDNQHCRKPLLILDERDIKRLNEEFNKK